MNSSCAVLFSGGTDSLCAAALACKEYQDVHLLTFFEEATKTSPIPNDNLEKLIKKYPGTKIQHSLISTDSAVKKLSFNRYFESLFKFKFLNLATPGISSLTWHCAAINYCKERGINSVYDGMTKELLHLPGHMPEVRELFKALYLDFGINFSSPVIDWEVPPDQRFVERLIVDRHGFTLTAKPTLKTTGQWLFENELLPHPNVKGSFFDQRMQHDCYPFVVYNMLVFWIYEPLFGYENFKKKLTEFIKYKILLAKDILLNVK